MCVFICTIHMSSNMYENICIIVQVCILSYIERQINWPMNGYYSIGMRIKEYKIHIIQHTCVCVLPLLQNYSIYILLRGIRDIAISEALAEMTWSRGGKLAAAHVSHDLKLGAFLHISSCTPSQQSKHGSQMTLPSGNQTLENPPSTNEFSLKLPIIGADHV